MFGFEKECSNKELCPLVAPLTLLVFHLPTLSPSWSPLHIRVIPGKLVTTTHIFLEAICTCVH